MKICITGAAGNISAALIPLLCNGLVFGDKLKITLSLLDIDNPNVNQIIEGLKLELMDCSYPLLEGIYSSTNPKEAFKDCDVIIYLGGFPRKPGMERKDLLKINGKIYKEQAEALINAKKDVKCLVVANPCNTNCLILQKYSKGIIPKENFTCLSRLDHNRVKGLLKEIGKECQSFVWGNHSNTCFPDSIEGIFDSDFIKKVQDRGSEVLKTKGTSSILSAANAIKDHLRDLYFGNKDIVSMGIISNGEYNVKKCLVFSYPVKCFGDWKYEIVQGIKIDEFRMGKFISTIKELEEEENEAEEI